MFPLTLAPTIRDVVQIKADFPALHGSVHGQPLTFLDRAASTQKLVAVLDAMDALFVHEATITLPGVDRPS